MNNNFNHALHEALCITIDKQDCNCPELSKIEGINEITLYEALEYINDLYHVLLQTSIKCAIEDMLLTPFADYLTGCSKGERAKRIYRTVRFAPSSILLNDQFKRVVFDVENNVVSYTPLDPYTRETRVLLDLVDIKKIRERRGVKG